MIFSFSVLMLLYYSRVRFALQSYDNFKQFVRLNLIRCKGNRRESSNKLNFDLTEDQLFNFIGCHQNKDMGIEAYQESVISAYIVTLRQ